MVVVNLLKQVGLFKHIPTKPWKTAKENFWEVFIKNNFVAVKDPAYLWHIMYLSIYRSSYLPTCLPACLPACLPTYLPACLPTYRASYLPIYLFIYLSIYLYIVKSFLACSLTKYKIEKATSYFHRMFWIAWNSFSAVKSLNSVTIFTKNSKQICRELLKRSSS